MDLNSFCACGRLVADAEVRTAKTNGKQFVTFRMAINGFNKDVLYMSCIKYDATAIVQYLTKGKQVAINGSLRMSKYTKGNTEMESISCVVSNLQLITAKEQSYNEYTAERHLGVQKEKEPQAPQGPENFELGIDDADIPF